MMPLRCIALLLLSLIVTGPPARAQTDTSLEVELTPHLATGEGSWSPGITPAAILSVQSIEPSTTWFVEAAAGGLLLLDADLNTEPLALSGTVGIARNFFRPSPTPPPPPSASTERPSPQQRGRDFGRVEFGLDARYETTQTFDDQNVAGGLQLQYARRARSGWARLIPSVIVSAEGALPVRADAREAVGADTDGFVLVRGMASVTPGLGAALPPDGLNPLDLHVYVDGRWEGATGTAWRAEGLNTAFYGAATLLYELREAVGFIEQVYVRFADGRIPPTTVAHRVWTIGIVLGLSGTAEGP